jgi:Trk K+ transport system NAD-binding subunit
MCNPALVNKRVSDVVLPGDSLILTIRRDGEVRVPHGSTQLQYGDHLSILGEVDSLEAVRRLLEA